MSVVYVGDLPVIKCNVGVTITGATVSMKWKNPSGSTGTWTSGVSVGADGKSVQYVVSSTSTLNAAGTWHVQPYVDTTGAWEGHGEIASFYVSSLLVP